MRVCGNQPDGSLCAEPDSRDGRVQIGLRNAQAIAKEQGQIVHFQWNGQPIAVAADSDLSLILRTWESRTPSSPVIEIGPHPDPATTPEFTHGIIEVTISR